MPRAPREETFGDLSQIGTFFCRNHIVRTPQGVMQDPETGRWVTWLQHRIAERIQFVAQWMAVEVLAFAIVDDHFSLVIRTRPDWLEQWDDREVVERWLIGQPPRRFRVPYKEQVKTPLTTPLWVPHKLKERDIEKILKDPEQVANCRQRMANPSSIMKRFAEPIARLHNAATEGEGAVFQGHFPCSPLLDESAVFTGITFIELLAAEDLQQKGFDPAWLPLSSLGLRVQSEIIRARESGTILILPECLAGLETNLSADPVKLQVDTTEDLAPEKEQSAEPPAELPLEPVADAEVRLEAVPEAAQEEIASPQPVPVPTSQPVPVPTSLPEDWLAKLDFYLGFPPRPDVTNPVLSWKELVEALNWAYRGNQERPFLNQSGMKEFFWERYRAPPETWPDAVKHFRDYVRRAAGRLDSLRLFAKYRGRLTKKDYEGGRLLSRN